MIQMNMGGYVLSLHWTVVAAVAFLVICILLRAIRGPLEKQFGVAKPALPAAEKSPSEMLVSLAEKMKSAVRLIVSSGDSWVMLLLAVFIIPLEFFVNRYALGVMFPSSELGNVTALGLVFALIGAAALGVRRNASGSAELALAEPGDLQDGEYGGGPGTQRGRLTGTKAAPTPGGLNENRKASAAFFGLAIVTGLMGGYATWWTGTADDWPFFVVLTATFTGVALRFLLSFTAAIVGREFVELIIAPLLIIVVGVVFYLLVAIFALVAQLFQAAPGVLLRVLGLLGDIGEQIVTLVRKMFGLRLPEPALALMLPISRQVVGSDLEVSGTVRGNISKVMIIAKEGFRRHVVGELPVGDGAFRGEVTLPEGIRVTHLIVKAGRHARRVRIIHRVVQTVEVTPNVNGDQIENGGTVLERQIERGTDGVPALPRRGFLRGLWSILAHFFVLSLLCIVTGCTAPVEALGNNQPSTALADPEHRASSVTVFVLLDRSGSWWWQKLAGDGSRLGEKAREWMAVRLTRALLPGDKVVFVSIEGGRSADEEVLAQAILPGKGPVDPAFVIARKNLEKQIRRVGPSTARGSNTWKSLDHISAMASQGQSDGRRVVVLCLTDFLIDPGEDRKAPQPSPMASMPRGTVILPLFVPHGDRDAAHWDTFRSGVGALLKGTGAEVGDVREPADCETFDIQGTIGRLR